MADLDLSELSPAPWEVYRCKSSDCRPDQACGLNNESFDCSYDECHHPLTLADAQFMALARNAFDVMLRRRWTAIPVGEHWEVVQWSGDDLNFIGGVGGPFLDPFTALVETDQWYTEQEKK